MTIHNPWERLPAKTGMVDIGTHKLLARVFGPPRGPGDPIVIIEAGAGGTSTPWIGIMRALAPSVRVLAYNRAGLSGSETAPKPGRRTAVDLAQDFESLLQAAGIAAPYLIVAHSFAGIIVRTWMEVHRRFADVAGVVFVDTATEDTYRRMPIRSKDYWFMFEELDVPRILGYDDVHKLLTEEEYDAILHENDQERLAIDDSANQLAEYMQYDRRVLEDTVVSVIKGFLAEDLRRLVEEAERVGSGTPQQRKRIKDGLVKLDQIMDECVTDQLQLSTSGRLVTAKRHAGHMVICGDPAVVLNEIEWVLYRYEIRRASSASQ